MPPNSSSSHRAMWREASGLDEATLKEPARVTSLTGTMGVPSFSGRGRGVARIGQGGRHLTGANTLSAFGRFNLWGEGGGAVRFRPIRPVGGGGVLSLSADSTTGADAGFWGGGGGGCEVILITRFYPPPKEVVNLIARFCGIPYSTPHPPLPSPIVIRIAHVRSREFFNNIGFAGGGGGIPYSPPPKADSTPTTPIG